MLVPIGSTNVSDTSNTVRYYSVDANIHTLTIMTGTDLNNLKIVPFINAYSIYFQSSVTNIARSELNVKFVFNHQILSANMLKMTVTIQPTISMYEFRGSMLLVNIQQIRTEKSAYLSNPTLTATDYMSQKFPIGNTSTTGKLSTANFHTAFSGFGTSFNGKCFLGFESISYTKLTGFSFELGKNTYHNYDKYSQVLTSTTSGLIPEIDAVFFCLGLGKECSDSSKYYDMMDKNCYPQTACPLPIPGDVTLWPHINICPWCQELICVSCLPTNRSECSACQLGSNSFLNPVTKKCECNVGYHFAYTILNPVTWNGATQYAYNCIINCTYLHPGCDLNQCDAGQCFQCLFDYMFVNPVFGPRQCLKCSIFQARCVTCHIQNICDTCEDGYYLVPIISTTNASQMIGRSCSPCISYCKLCTNNIECETCFSGYQLASGKSQCLCNATLANLLNCNACTVNITCTSCDTGFYISSATGLCEPCSYIHAKCKTCSDSNTCTACNTGYGLDPAAISGKVICSQCNKQVSNCDDCLQINDCLHCAAPYGLAAPLHCMNCELLKVPGCIQCTIASAPCNKCNSTSFLLNGTCFFCHIYHHLCTSCQANAILQTLECIQCQPGFYVGLNTTSNSNQCLPCPKAMRKCLECSSSAFCTKCEFPNLLGTTNQCTQCEFPYVNYNNGSCVKYAGCANTLEASPGNMTCLACNDSLHFVFQPLSKNCLCSPGYYETIANEPTQKCQSICGDGILIFPDEQCDDKNLIDYDGCSKNCKEQDNFDCNQASPSACVLIRDFTKFQLVYAERIIAQNKGALYFSIEPYEIGLTMMNWSKLITLNFVSKAVKASSLSYSYSIETGMLRVYFPYLQTVENSMISYEVKFDPKMIKSSQALFKDVRQVKGANFPLILENSLILQHSSYISMIVLALSILALVQFYLGSYLGKMIGLETIQIFQFVCYARFLVFTKNTTLLNSFHDFKYTSSGFSNPEVLFGAQKVSQSRLVSQEFNKIDLQKYYLLNINFWLIPIILVALAYMVVSVRKWFEWRTLMQGIEPSAKYKYVLTIRSVQYIYEQCIFPEVMMIGMMVYFNNMLCFLTNDPATGVDTMLLEMQSIALQTLSQYAIMAVFAFEVMSSLKQFIKPSSANSHSLSLRQKYELDESSPHKPNYHPLYICVYSLYYFVLYIIMSLDIQIESFSLALEITMIATMGYCALIWFWSPYFKVVNIHNTFLKINHIIAAIILIFYEVFNRSVSSISPLSYVFLAYCILGLLSIVLIGGFVRIYFEHLYRKKLSFRANQGIGKLTIVEENQILKKMTKKEKTDRMLINNRFTLKNQLTQLKKSHIATLSSDPFSSFPGDKLTQEQQTFFMKKIKQGFQQKNHMYRDLWGAKKLDEPLVQQASKPTQLNAIINNQPEAKIVQATDLNPQRDASNPTKKKQKHTVQEKETLQKLKRKLRSELIQISE